MSRCRPQGGCAPCPECEGDREGASALHFAFDMLEYKQPGGAFWAAAEVGEIVRTSVVPSERVSAYLQDLVLGSTLPSGFLALPADDEDAAPQGGGPSGDLAPVRADGADSERLKQWEHWSDTITAGARWGDRKYHPGSVPEDDGGGGGGDTPGRRCGVDTFLYPRCWRPKSEGGSPSVCYEVEVTYLDTRGTSNSSPVYDCRCCVFRQYLRRVSGEADAEYFHPDRVQEGGVVMEAGGGRRDGSSYTDPDVPAHEAAYISTCQRLEYTDDALSQGTDVATWDFIGIVYDRCHSWAIRDVRRMILMVRSRGPKRGGRMRMNAPIPPRDPRSGWSHSNPHGEGSESGAPPGERGDPPSVAPGDDLRVTAKWPKGYINCCGPNWPTEEEAQQQAAEEAQRLDGAH